MKTDTFEKRLEDRATDHAARTERKIVLMEEYRTRVTTDVVTGKLDVRPAAHLHEVPDCSNSDPPREAEGDPAANEDESERKELSLLLVFPK